MQAFQMMPEGHFVMVNCSAPDCITATHNSSIRSLADCQQAAVNPCPKKQGCKKQESTMYDFNDGCYEATETERTKDYLDSRLSSARHEKDRGLMETFAMRDMDEPHTAAELVERIQKGLFIMDDRNKDNFSYKPQDNLQWRDPAKPADKAGYEAAEAKLTAAYYEARDAIKVFAPEKGLETLKAFQAATFN